LAVGQNLELGVLAGAGGATLDEAPERQPMIAAVDLTALQRLFFLPIGPFQAKVHYGFVDTRVERWGVMPRGDAGQGIRHLSVGYEIAAAKLDAIDAEILGGHVKEPLAKKIGLEPARRAIGATGRLVGELHVGLDIDIR